MVEPAGDPHASEHRLYSWRQPFSNESLQRDLERITAFAVSPFAMNDVRISVWPSPPSEGALICFNQCKRFC
jgi:hypothetical protein